MKFSEFVSKFGFEIIVCSLEKINYLDLDI